MIDESILDEIIPVPDIEDLKDEKVAELTEEGFTITNFKSGGVFYTILMIILRIRIELVTLLRNVLSNMFVAHSSGDWLDLKAADYSKSRKQASKVRGNVTVSRTADGETIKIAKGTVFKTLKDASGNELRYITLNDKILAAGTLSVDVLVEAEKVGTVYNVPEGQIVRSLTHLEGIETISNNSGWITKEGTDIEDDESFRSRVQNSWSELSYRTTAAAYKSVCEEVEGVLFVEVDAQHPRGQGTVDIIVTGTAGAATESLLQEVQAKAESIAGEYDNILVRSSEVEEVDINVTLVVPTDVATDTMVADANAAITNLLKISKNRKMNELTLVDLIVCLKTKIPSIKNIRFTSPATDISLANNIVIVAGEITITIQRE